MTKGNYLFNEVQGFLIHNKMHACEEQATPYQFLFGFDYRKDALKVLSWIYKNHRKLYYQINGGKKFKDKIFPIIETACFGDRVSVDYYCIYWGTMENSRG